MDDNISNINNISWIRPYNSKKDSNGKDKRKKRKKGGDKDIQNYSNLDDPIGNVEQNNQENDSNVGRKIDIDI